jgi:Flp pilus assembly protein TadG
MVTLATPLQRALRRRHLRGAALVEAAVVLPVMVAMLGLSMMMYQAYSTKLVSNQQVRSEVLDYASHACKAQKITYSGNSKGSGSVATGAGGAGANDSTSAGALGASGGSAKASGIMAKAEVSYTTKSITNPKPNVATKGTGLTLKVNGMKSSALCIEEPQDGSISGIFSYAKNKIGSLAP